MVKGQVKTEKGNKINYNLSVNNYQLKIAQFSFNPLGLCLITQLFPIPLNCSQQISSSLNFQVSDPNYLSSDITKACVVYLTLNFQLQI